jgi:hypothetical protein
MMHITFGIRCGYTDSSHSGQYQRDFKFVIGSTLFHPDETGCNVICKLAICFDYMYTKLMTV